MTKAILDYLNPMRSRAAIMLGLCTLVLGCGTSVADPPAEGFYTGQPRKEDLETIERFKKLQQDYQQAKVDCAKRGEVARVIPLTPDGLSAQFVCVSAEDPNYKIQHIGEDVPVTRTDLDSRLQPFVGQDVSMVVAQIGGPQGEPIVNGDVVYSWGVSTQTYFAGISIPNENLTTFCTIDLVTDRATGVIKRYRWREKRGGCETFAQKLSGVGSTHPAAPARER